MIGLTDPTHSRLALLPSTSTESTPRRSSGCTGPRTSISLIETIPIPSKSRKGDCTGRVPHSPLACASISPALWPFESRSASRVTESPALGSLSCSPLVPSSHPPISPHLETHFDASDARRTRCAQNPIQSPPESAPTHASQWRTVLTFSSYAHCQAHVGPSQLTTPA